MAAGTPKFTLYTSEASQWAMVPQLGLVEKGYLPHEFEAKEVDLLEAGNFDIDYLKVNNNGTIPALTAPVLDTPLMQSTDILEYLDRAHPESDISLAPEDDTTKQTVQRLLELVHSMVLDSNLILLAARDPDEMEKVKGNFHGFITTRQRVLEENRARYPDHPFYGPKAEDNGKLHHLYVTPIGAEHEQFFRSTHEAYQKFATAFKELESTLVLPYAAGGKVTYADLHIVPWLSHVLCFAGAEDFNDFGKLEARVRKSDPGFAIGPNVRQWWRNMQRRESFQKVFPVLH
ncbi:uncharacterized protein Z518_05669 [Rhinocladiella mackenziei CBS 650.93]|uniref:Rhinocladiella mackenziei CBS 650.93 unplaced genomic scaffold supercont1.4, whole genome shotgun sequence n=1 Tax=Rhinocladiella mackenziei CBS 650.93 TaxID=1442369 RepID=A0A0D2H2Y5_9EURO|nr:uncharacterized protein Z518_05669 [Rhinocladiella mackenziei CBS 650.93]KIX04798.1 hypothetical protein Z518_05669 [Rhinocladiella mackenziei CBS 650.93]